MVARTRTISVILAILVAAPIVSAHWTGPITDRHLGRGAAHVSFGDELPSIRYWGVRACYDSAGRIPASIIIVDIPDTDPQPAIGDAATGRCGPPRTSDPWTTGRAPMPFPGLGTGESDPPQDMDCLLNEAYGNYACPAGTDSDPETGLYGAAAFVYQLEAGLPNPLGIPGLPANYTTIERREVVSGADRGLRVHQYLACIDIDGNGCAITASAALAIIASPDYVILCRTAVGATGPSGIPLFWGSDVPFNDPLTPGAVEPCALRTQTGTGESRLRTPKECRVAIRPHAYNNTTLDCDLGLMRRNLSAAPDNDGPRAIDGYVWNGMDPASLAPVDHVFNASRPVGANTMDPDDKLFVGRIRLGDAYFVGFGPGPVVGAVLGNLSDCNDPAYEWPTPNSHGQPTASDGGSVRTHIARTDITETYVRP
ncbi:MAG: hypothetical protein ACT4PT_14305 [Methanobacteriota archaeon]